MTDIDENKPRYPGPCLRVSKEMQEKMVADGRLLTGEQIRGRAAMFTEEQLREKAYELAGQSASEWCPLLFGDPNQASTDAEADIVRENIKQWQEDVAAGLMRDLKRFCNFLQRRNRREFS